jgi:hypothetical protein
MDSSFFLGTPVYVIINLNRGKDFYDILYSFKQIPCSLNEKKIYLCPVVNRL